MKKITTIILLLCGVMTASAQNYVYIKHYSNNRFKRTFTVARFDKTQARDSIVFDISPADIGTVDVEAPSVVTSYYARVAAQRPTGAYVLVDAEYGICYSDTKAEPTVSDTKKAFEGDVYSHYEGTDTPQIPYWEITLDDLKADATYNYRAYVTLGGITVYSEPKSFHTSKSIF